MLSFLLFGSRNLKCSPESSQSQKVSGYMYIKISQKWPKKTFLLYITLLHDHFKNGYEVPDAIKNFLYLFEKMYRLWRLRICGRVWILLKSLWKKFCIMKVILLITKIPILSGLGQHCESLLLAQIIYEAKLDDFS